MIFIATVMEEAGKKREKAGDEKVTYETNSSIAIDVIWYSKKIRIGMHIAGISH